LFTRPYSRYTYNTHMHLTLHGVIYTPLGEVIPPTFLRHPPPLYLLNPDNRPLPQYLTGCVQCYFTVHTCGSYSSALILHSLCRIKHCRNVLTIQLLMASPQNPTGATPPEPCWGTSPDPLTQLDTSNYQITENTLHV